MSKNNTSTAGQAVVKKRREPLTDTNLLMFITIGIFVGMYALGAIFLGGGFRNPQQFIDIFNNNAFLIIISCGLSIVMVTGGIDISVGGVVALVTMSCVVFLDSAHGNVFVTLLLALGIGLAFGLLHGTLVAYLEIQPFIVTLAGMFLARGLTTIISVNPHTAQNEAFLALKSTSIRIPWEFLGSYGKTGNFIPAKVELGAIVAVVVVVVIFAIQRWSRFGRNLYAIGGNSQSAITLGINVKRTKFMAYLLCGLLAGIGGFVYLLHTGAGDVANATQAEMKAIASSIIGGTLLTGGVGTVIGTLFGTLTLVTIDNIVRAAGTVNAIWLKPWWQKITTGGMLFFFILLQSLILAYRGKGDFAFSLPKWKPKNKSGGEGAPASEKSATAE